MIYYKLGTLPSVTFYNTSFSLSVRPHSHQPWCMNSSCLKEHDFCEWSLKFGQGVMRRLFQISRIAERILTSYSI